ncbi:MAG: replication-associated recombination protein A [Candidatus Marinimicrobia bacterium]|nr:replication-associated recombination protein A [Candidatus Neomarinimicrobiota bacterium]MCK9484162.1 replication-associated recombination protein A [Candidatus Neomarinimicrobiota bacterium]MCK9559661.1 replication-associated recombination protein A [Candidatus Neomarinimicrobiota bacterium]MDD5062297.1 replication-associated recombination protein A [Candidatus Neomarinimicrobiota bacterium]MDD5229778.1 replication-associated recombination protein A [Candidatus Neomarinimicrobiota bacterium
MDLFTADQQTADLLPPLAERMRPHRLEGFIGQEEIVAEGKILRKALAAKKIFSMILWGPPGSGKTTLAKIIANYIAADFHQISAVSAGVKDVRAVIEKAAFNRRQNRTTLLFIDEIHRFNKAQQDALLHAVEDGSLILIGATTENPSFEVIAPLISRCRVLKLAGLSDENLASIIDLAITKDIILLKYQIEFEPGAKDFLIKNVNGDARKLLNALEICQQLAAPAEGVEFYITTDLIKEALQQRRQLYDKTGDYHYDIISAFIKSVRGSDPDAAVYWMTLMLEGGEDPLFIARRLIILASEDIGNADPSALPLATAGFQAVHAIGMPEAAIVLSQVTTYLASTVKSNAAYMALENARQELKTGEAPNVPLHLRNAPTQLMKAQGYHKGYRYPHSYEDHFVKENYFPNGRAAPTFYFPTNLGREKFIRERLAQLWPERYQKEKTC